MDVLWEDVVNALWHSFDALDQNKTGKVTKSRLKVLTASLGTLLGFHNVEKSLEEHRSTSTLNFDDYMIYLRLELPISESLPPSDIRKYCDQIEEVCWIVCKQAFLVRDYIAFPSNCVFYLFRIFCLLGELKIADGSLAVVIDADEVKYVIKVLTEELGQEWNADEFEQVICVFSSVRFPVFLTLVETQIALNVETQGLIEATKEIYDMFVLDVLKKGMLKRRITKLGGWWEYWYVLQPYCLSWYSSRDQSEKRGKFPLTPESKVESVPDLQGTKGSRFTITNGKTLELLAEDYKTKVQWISAITTAIEYCMSPCSYQRHLAAIRRNERKKAQIKKEKEEANRNQQLQELKAERKAREEAEAQLIEECKRRKELESAKEKYEKLLEEERQEKKDEEIVRKLQSKMLLEEWEKREQLELVKAEQERLLCEEKKKREELESRTKTVDELVQRLNDLENEKCRLDNTLKETKEKLVMTQRNSQTLLRKPKPKLHSLQRSHSLDFGSCCKQEIWANRSSD